MPTLAGAWLTSPSMELRVKWCAFTALLVLTGCSDNGSDVSLPPLEITTSTTGSSLDSDGYTATINGGDPRAIGDNDTLVVTDLSSGDHLVELSGIAENCQVGGTNPRNVTLVSGEAESVDFAVTCSAPPEPPPSAPPAPPPTGTSIQRWTLVGSVPLSNWADVWGTSTSDYFVVGVPLSSENVTTGSSGR